MVQETMGNNDREASVAGHDILLKGHPLTHTQALCCGTRHFQLHV
jgi:hypothetical protein